jgi:hypothetical protein
MIIIGRFWVIAEDAPALPFFRIWPEASWLGKRGYVVEAKPAAVLDFVNSFQVGGGFSTPAHHRYSGRQANSSLCCSLVGRT